jgi:FAD:protein FMN transferase
MLSKNSQTYWLMHCAILAIFLFSLASCSPKPKLIKIQGFAQGTSYNITYQQPSQEKVDGQDLEEQINQEFLRIDKSLSNYRNDSNIEIFNAQTVTDPIEVEQELVALVEIARDIHRASKGCYDLTIKPLFDLWGFKQTVFTPPSDEKLQETLNSVGFSYIETLDVAHLRKKIPAVRLDISSIGQGYTVSKIASILESAKIDNYLVEIGGELQVKGKKPDGSFWRIALEKPLPNERRLHKIVNFEDGKIHAMMTSGTYRHYFDKDGKRYSHILDARSGKPIEHNSVSVTVINSDPTLADAWSTALLCLGSQEGIEIANQHHLKALFIDQNNAIFTEIPTNPWKNMTGISLSDK